MTSQQITPTTTRPRLFERAEPKPEFARRVTIKIKHLAIGALVVYGAGGATAPHLVKSTLYGNKASAAPTAEATVVTQPASKAQGQ